jgi:protein-L-isoaspartate(D-aspartate) O-methyltransferase
MSIEQSATAEKPDEASFERARTNMIQQQIRPWGVLDASVLELLGRVPRDRFVPPHLRSLAYVDCELPLNVGQGDTGEVMLAPKIEARTLQDLHIQPRDLVLEVGTGSGYMAALAAHKAQTVWTIELLPGIAAFGAANLARAGVRNAHVEEGDGAGGWPAHAPYDVIIVSGALPEIPAGMLAQLKLGGRLAAIVGSAPAMQLQIVRRISEDRFETRPVLETVTRYLRNTRAPSAFRFR